MKKVFLTFLLLLIYQTLFSQKDDRIEDISKQLSELLMERKKIEDFKYVIKIKSLYPDEGLSNVKDSPAELILGMLYRAELELPKTWNKILKVSSQFKINKNSNYINTYSHKMGVDNYIVSTVIKAQSKYYVFSYNLLEWGNDIYISRFYKELKEFESLEKIDLNPFIIIDDEVQSEFNEMDDLIAPGEMLINPNN